MVGDNFSTVGIPSVLWRLFSTMGQHQYSGDNIITVEAIQHSGKFFISPMFDN